MSFSVSLIIPILNEAATLPELLAALQMQTFRPREVIFVDAGSTDDSRALIENWGQQNGWAKGACRVLLVPGAMPGAGRNAGVRQATSDWLVFLDGGIKPQPDWLENLCRYAEKNRVPAVFGLCHFSAEAAFAKTVCALSYGHGAIHPVIPASLFQRSVFERIGYFPEALRAGEDLVWVQRLIAQYGPREICAEARVEYTHFPSGWQQAIRKWWLTEYHCVQAGVRSRQQWLYLIALPLLYFGLFTANPIGISVFIAYLLLRGVIDPIRRSRDRPWWGNRPLAVLISPLLVAALDLAKVAGIVYGLARRFGRPLSTATR